MPTERRPTEVRVLTAAGRGAIAVVEAVGPEAAKIVAERFEGSAPFEAAPLNAIRFGRWRRDDNGVGEEVVAVRTAPDRVEVHCHGGSAAPAAIVRSLVELGAVAVQGPTPAKSPAEEALHWLTQAPTERVAGVLLDQAGGALESAIEGLLAYFARGELAEARSALERLLSRERLASRLVTPWRVVVTGRPNVGKSALVNALLGYDRVIVFDQPGTTRDVVTATTAIGGWPVTLADTAGVRATDDPLEAAGVEIARQTLATADIVVAVEEAGVEVERGCQEAAVHVASKTDLAPSGWRAPEGVIATCAPRSEGVPELLAAIERAMAVATPEPSEAVPLGTWRYDLLRSTREEIDRGDAAGAEAAVRALLALAGL